MLLAPLPVASLLNIEDKYHLMEGQTAEQVLQRLQDELNALHLQHGGASDSLDFRIPPPSKGSGPRLFCGHVPKEATEDLVKAHFSRWGLVTDVYFPRHKKTLKRRPFCFVTFAAIDAAERALAESPLNICGIPIKNLTMVEDRDKYYKEKHAAAQQALLTALQNLGASDSVTPEHVNNVAAMIAMEGISTEQLISSLFQQPLPASSQQQQQQYNNVYVHGRHSIGHAPSTQISSSLDAYQHHQKQQQQYIEQSAALASLRQAMNVSVHPAHFSQQQNLNIGNVTSASTGTNTNTASTATNTPSSTSSIQKNPMLMRRDASMSSLSSQSDWYSTTSSARNSLDVLSSSNMFSGGSSHGFGGAFAGRLSVDTALQVRQQLMGMAAAAASNGNGSGSGQSGGGFHHSGAGPSTWMQQQQQQQPASVMQSAFYQPSLTAITTSSTPSVQQQQQQTTQGSSSLPSIKEGISIPGSEQNLSNAAFISSLWNNTQQQQQHHHQQQRQNSNAPPSRHSLGLAPPPSSTTPSISSNTTPSISLDLQRGHLPYGGNSLDIQQQQQYQQYLGNTANTGANTGANTTTNSLDFMSGWDSNGASAGAQGNHLFFGTLGSGRYSGDYGPATD